MKLQFASPIVALNPGDVFSVKVFANSGGFWNIKMWGLDIRYDASVLSYVQGSFKVVAGAGFANPLVVSDVAGAVIVSAQMLAGANTVTSLLHVANFSLSVNAGNFDVLQQTEV